MHSKHDHASSEMEILRKNQNEMLEIKITVTQMKIAFDRIMSRPDMTEERISVLEGMPIEPFKTKGKENKR